ncbi:hypothetical protein [Streptomyces coffeae]|uniref:SprT-like domain-containing protein n=1 Tax=Streptomyces coffeae TaxID=621382 RepID=A0ABS1N9X4_9ACTN|nr:hypothetical protein [Streptomyces coffeae]MBL1096883.1 hypothetical protein [Streptomyces coffeae]
MRVLSHGLSRRYRGALDHVTEIADAAAALVEQHTGDRIGPADLAVTNTAGVTEVIVTEHQALFGVSDPSLWRARGRYGATTLTRRGVLVVINAEECRGRTTEITKTVVHELVHAAQYARPGRRAAILRHLRNNYGLEPMAAAEVRAANRQIDTDEREAKRLERLAHNL